MTPEDQLRRLNDRGRWVTAPLVARRLEHRPARIALQVVAASVVGVVIGVAIAVGVGGLRGGEPELAAPVADACDPRDLHAAVGQTIQHLDHVESDIEVTNAGQAACTLSWPGPVTLVGSGDTTAVGSDVSSDVSAGFRLPNDGAIAHLHVDLTRSPGNATADCFMADDPVLTIGLRGFGHTLAVPWPEGFDCDIGNTALEYRGFNVTSTIEPATVLRADSPQSAGSDGAAIEGTLYLINEACLGLVGFDGAKMLLRFPSDTTWDGTTLQIASDEPVHLNEDVTVGGSAAPLEPQGKDSDVPSACLAGVNTIWTTSQVTRR